MKQETYKINTPRIAHETIDGEVVILDLEKGHYYSLLNAGADIWSGVERGFDRQKILAETLKRYEGESDEIQAAVARLLDEMAEQGLIIPVPNGAEEYTFRLDGDAITNEYSARAPFEPPKLEKFTDLEDLFLLDPVYEVDDSGWPRSK